MDTKKTAKNLIELVLNISNIHIASDRDENGSGYPHLLWMLKGIRDGYIQHEKAHRWIGYVQGMLVANHKATLQEMKELNKS